ncbi:MAG: hypothetical protein O7F71_10115 [Gammaproteobacteria bacterium]|nr:hypothetical protein [Gammaproteobacteria bacterium]
MQYQTPNPTSSTRLFKTTLSISLFLHGLVLLVVIQREHSAIPEITTLESTFHISLSVEVEKPDPVPEPPAQPPEEQPTPKIVDIEEPDPGDKDQTTPRVLQEPRLKQSAPSMIKALVEQDKNAAFRASLTPDCTLTQRATEVRICEPDDYDVTGQATLTAYEETFGDAFRDLSETRSEFHRDMAMVDSLMGRQEELAAINPSDELEFALIAEERSYLREEIFRIDRKYEQTNLFKLIPVGRKVIKGLLEAVKRKN